jgi:predicted ArsR family transcriptional regulator
MKNDRPARDKILILLKKYQRLNSSQIGKTLGMTAVGARQHLTRMERDGLVVSELVRQKTGRPTLFYHLTSYAEDSFPQDYLSLAMSFLTGLEAIDGRTKVEEVLRHRCIKQLEKYWARFGNNPLEKRIKILAQMREEEGFMSEVETRKNEILLIEYNCPILCIAQDYPVICELELDLLQQVLQTPVERIKHLIQGQPACAYSIKRPKKKK